MSNIVTTENTPVRRTGTGWHLIINTAFTIFFPESDVMVRCFLCGYYSGCFAGFLVWVLFGDGVYSSESHCDTAM